MGEFNLRSKEKSIMELTLAEYKVKKKLVADRKINETQVSEQNYKLASTLSELMGNIAAKYGALFDVNINDKKVEVKVHLGMNMFHTTATVDLPHFATIMLNQKNLKKALSELEIRVRWIRRFLLKNPDMLKSHGDVPQAKVFFTTRDRYFI